MRSKIFWGDARLARPAGFGICRFPQILQDPAHPNITTSIQGKACGSATELALRTFPHDMCVCVFVHVRAHAMRIILL